MRTDELADASRARTGTPQKIARLLRSMAGAPCERCVHRKATTYSIGGGLLCNECHKNRRVDVVVERQKRERAAMQRIVRRS
jgi:hypothetical protein